MADSTYTKGDTWPPQKLRAKAGAAGTFVNLEEADEIKALIRGGTVLISGTVHPIWPPEEDDQGDEWNGEYRWAEHDLSHVRDDYDVEVKVFWDKGSSPPKIQTFPNKNPRPTLAVNETNEDEEEA